MNWLILILAGCMEVAFTFCLGMAKENSGTEELMWWGGFGVALALSMYLMARQRRLDGGNLDRIPHC